MKPIRAGISLFLIGILILSLTMTACSPTGASPDPDDDIVLYETTKIVAEEEAQNILELSEDGDRILFAEVTAFVAGIKAGDVLVSEEPVPGAEYGFLKRVTGVSNGGRQLDVEPATLEDVIQQGVIEVTQTIQVEDMMTNALWAPGIVVTQDQEGERFRFAPADGVTIEGCLRFTAEPPVIHLRAGFFDGIEEFEFVFSPGFEMETTLTIERDVSWDPEPVDILKLDCPPISIWGPVTLNLGGRLVVGTEGEISGSLETKVAYVRGYDIGFRYDDQGWNTINGAYGDGATVQPPAFNGRANALVYGGVVLSLGTGLGRTAEAGIDLELLANLEASGEITNDPWQWQYDVELYLSAQITARLDILGIAGISHDFKPWLWPEDPPWNLAYGASGQVILALDEGAEPLAGVTINFSGGHSSITTGRADDDDDWGYWSKHLLRGHVTVTPEKSGFVFTPPSRTISRSSSHVNFEAVAAKDPTVTIIYPKHNSRFNEGEHILFFGTGKDQFGRDIGGSDLVWASDIDGEFGDGEVCGYDQLSEGSHTITLRATDGNERTGTASVLIVVGLPPNLTVSSVTTSESQLHAGDTVLVEFTVQNLGGPIHDEFVNRVFFSKMPYGPAYFILGDFAMTIGGDTSKTDTVEVTIPSVVGGDWYIAVFTDANDVIEEADEGNNINSTQVTVLDEAPVFEIVALDVPPTTKTGEVINIHYAVENSGEGKGTRTIKLTIEDSDGRLVYQLMGNETLAPGAVFSETIQYAFDTPDEYTVALHTVDDHRTTTIQVEAQDEGEEEPVHFACPNLEAAIRETIGKPMGDIYPSDLAGLTRLYAYYKSIADLSGIEHCTDLVELYLCGNQIDNISPLAALTKLTTLDLMLMNSISDLSPLAGLAALRELKLSGNQISDLSSLASLTGLTYLGLDTNQIGDISPLGMITSLQTLYLTINQVSDISPLAGLANLRQLYLGQNQISDISALAGLTGLTGLNLADNQISDISPLANLSNLRGLGLGGNQISDISPLSSLANMEWLTLNDNQISNITPLSNLASLRGLMLQNNQISLPHLANVPNLSYLDLRDNQISDVSPLAAGLSNLTNLSLYLSRNRISDVSPLASLTSLTLLTLEANQISDISPLAELTNLHSLHLAHNSVNTISALANLTKLQTISLHDNQISDILPLVENEGLGDGDFVSLFNNPLSEQSINEYIPELEARGVDVSY